MNVRIKIMGEYLRKLRIEKSLTQREVAIAMGYTTAQFISNWERGVSYPPTHDLAKLAKILGLKDARALVFQVFRCKERELAEEQQRVMSDIKRGKRA